VLLGEGSGKVAVPLPEKKLNLGLKYTICGAFRAFFSSSLSLVLMQVTSWMTWIIYLFFISISGAIGGRGHPRSLPDSATDEHANGELSAVGLLSRSL